MKMAQIKIFIFCWWFYLQWSFFSLLIPRKNLACAESSTPFFILELFRCPPCRSYVLYTPVLRTNPGIRTDSYAYDSHSVNCTVRIRTNPGTPHPRNPYVATANTEAELGTSYSRGIRIRIIQYNCTTVQLYGWATIVLVAAERTSSCCVPKLQQAFTLLLELEEIGPRFSTALRSHSV